MGLVFTAGTSSICPGVPGSVSDFSHRALFTICAGPSAVTFTLKLSFWLALGARSFTTHSAYPPVPDTVAPPLSALPATISVPCGA